MFTVKRLNHAVLYVRNAQRAFEFYRDVLGFQVVEAMGERAYFLRANGSDNHHDLGLFGIGEQAPAPGRGDRVGLYHLAWEVETLPDLARAQVALAEAGALTGESDHGNSLSLYAKDPDGNEFEVFWMVPREEWESRGFGTRRLDLYGELTRRGLADAVTATT
ncbi:MAG: VOC family protein [Dehalococcoidia bacterium]|nr:VOC family protein [Dehalococcoidia bacterium]